MGKQILDRNEIGCPTGQSSPSEQARIRALSPEHQTERSQTNGQYVPFVHARDNQAEFDIIVTGAHCAGCVAKIEREVSGLDGVVLARMNLSTMRLRTAWLKTGDDNALPTAIIDHLGGLGYGAKPFEMPTDQKHHEAELKFLWKAMAVAGAALANIMVISVSVWAGLDMGDNTRTMMHILSACIALPAIAYSGRVFFGSAWRALKNKTTNMDVPISLALLLASGLSIYETVHGNPDTYFDAAVMLMFLLLIGRVLDQRLRLKTGEAAARLAAMQAINATVMQADGTTQTIPAAMVRPGDLVQILAGDIIPVDGEIIEGRSDIDGSIATGEALPISMTVGEAVFSGMVNLSAPIMVRAKQAANNSFLANISKLVEMGEQKKSKFVRIADRAAQKYVPVVHSVAAITFIGWIVAGGSLRTASLNAIAVLIITCPCALGLAVPAVQIVASGRLFRAGVLIKSSDALERLAKTDHAVFDKTGTLTLGNLELQNVADLDPKILGLAAALAQNSRHPISRAIVNAAHENDITLPEITNMNEQAGHGISGVNQGEEIYLGKPKGDGPTPQNDQFVQTFLTVADGTTHRLQFTDTLRAEAKATIAALASRGIASEILSGDTQAMVSKTAQDLGVSEWQGGVSPEQKIERLDTLKSQGLYPLMIGDGLNDAPALAQASVSMSLAGAADISRAASDIVLQGDRLSAIPLAIDVARAADRRVKENLGLAIGYNLIAIPLAVFGFVNPLIAALVMSGSSLLVSLNALRMGKIQGVVTEDPSP